MAICVHCNQEMAGDSGADTCTMTDVRVNGRWYRRIPTWEEGVRCHDCNTRPGGFHHPGCDCERCPVCGGQFISCGCRVDALRLVPTAFHEVRAAVEGYASMAGENLWELSDEELLRRIENYPAGR